MCIGATDHIVGSTAISEGALAMILHGGRVEMQRSLSDLKSHFRPILVLK